MKVMDLQYFFYARKESELVNKRSYTLLYHFQIFVVEENNKENIMYL